MMGTHNARHAVLVSAVMTAVLAGAGSTPANAGTTMTRPGAVAHVSDMHASGAAPAPKTAPTGPYSVLVMLASWGGPDSVTPAQAADIIGTQDSSFYAATSFGKFQGFVPTVTPWLTIPDPGSCDFDAIRASAEAAATAAGYTPATYDREVIYASDQTGYCHAVGLSGKADLPGRVAEIYGGYMQIGVTSHELGHTFGLNHSNALLCTDAAGNPVTLSSTCTTREYGDVFDTMGSSFQFGPHGRSGGLFNALETSEIGWLVPPQIQSVQTSETATLVPYEDQGTGLHALALAGDEGPGTFYVEYRRPIGWDALGYPLGLIVHRSYGLGTDLLDMTPKSPNGMQDAPLPVGHSWTGPYAADPTITLVSADATSATVRITYVLRPPGAPFGFLLSAWAAVDATTPAAPAIIGWEPSATPGVCSYQLQRSVNGGAFADVHLSEPAATSFEGPVRGGHDYRFRVRAVTCAGARSAWATGAAFHVSMSQQGAGTYAGAWYTAARGSAWGGSVTTTTRKGASVTFRATARSIGIVGTRGPGYGGYRVLVDGVVLTTISNMAATFQPHELIATMRWFTPGTQTIKLVNLATAGHPRLDVDGFVVLH